jgi:hypothetical protein
MVRCGVLFEVRAEVLNIIQTSVGFKGLNSKYDIKFTTCFDKGYLPQVKQHIHCFNAVILSASIYRVCPLAAAVQRRSLAISKSISISCSSSSILTILVFTITDQVGFFLHFQSLLSNGILTV